jgi:hypothetical protein
MQSTVGQTQTSPVMMYLSGNVPAPPLQAPLQLPVVTQLPTQLTGQHTAGTGRHQTHNKPTPSVCECVCEASSCLLLPCVPTHAQHSQGYCTDEQLVHACQGCYPADSCGCAFVCSAMPANCARQQLLPAQNQTLALLVVAPVLLQGRKRTVPPASEQFCPPQAAGVVMVNTCRCQPAPPENDKSRQQIVLYLEQRSTKRQKNCAQAAVGLRAQSLSLLCSALECCSQSSPPHVPLQVPLFPKAPTQLTGGQSLVLTQGTVDRVAPFANGQLPPCSAGLVMLKRSGMVPGPPPHAPVVDK